jgi:hypothetical protein
LRLDTFIPLLLLVHRTMAALVAAEADAAEADYRSQAATPAFSSSTETPCESQHDCVSPYFTETVPRQGKFATTITQ